MPRPAGQKNRTDEPERCSLYLSKAARAQLAKLAKEKKVPRSHVVEEWLLRSAARDK